MRVSTLKTLCRLLNDAGVDYLVVGGVAAIAHGLMRHTNDIDFVFALTAENLDKAMCALGSEGYKPLLPVDMRAFQDATIRETWIKEKGMTVFQLFSDKHPETSIDIFVTIPFDYEKEKTRTLSYQLEEGLGVPVVSREELIAMKLRAGRPQDLDDVARLKKIEANEGA